ncbi:MAG: hypothetical protein LBB04_00990 [Oscillospiraceae bacterium]|nr:hypothetical protein [Oscillospiraceae bacterium]
MGRKQRKNRCRKVLAKVLAGAFCALSWTPAVQAAEVITLGASDQLSKVIEEQWRKAAVQTHNSKPTMYVVIELCR